MENKEFRTEEQKVNYTYDAQPNYDTNTNFLQKPQDTRLCKECGRYISTEEMYCPHCGALDPARRNADAAWGLFWSCIPGIGLIPGIINSARGLKISFRTKTNRWKAIAGLSLCALQSIGLIVLLILLSAGLL